MRVCVFTGKKRPHAVQLVEDPEGHASASPHRHPLSLQMPLKKSSECFLLYLFPCICEGHISDLLEERFINGPDCVLFKFTGTSNYAVIFLSSRTCNFPLADDKMAKKNLRLRPPYIFSFSIIHYTHHNMEEKICCYSRL